MRCNYCDLVAIKSRARKEDKQVTVLADAEWGMGGMNIYLHSKDINIKNLPGGEDGDRGKYRVMWCKELPDQCACY